MPAIPKADTTSVTSKAVITARQLPPPNFGVEQMVTWLQSQMRCSNKEVADTLHTIEHSRDKLKALSALQQELRDMKTKAFKDGEDSKTTLDSSALDLAGYKKSETYDAEFRTIVKNPFTGKDETIVETAPATRVVVDMEKLEKQDWYKALSADGKAAAVQFLTECNTADGKVGEKQLDKFIDAVKDEVNTLNSDNELQMINLQHVMQTRNQAIQLASNIISVLDRSADVAINNIGKG
jgi:hypothetical protein